MTINEILKTRPYTKWHDSSLLQLSSYHTVHEVLMAMYKLVLYVPEEWVDPLRGYVLVAGLDVFIEQGSQRFAYRIL